MKEPLFLLVVSLSLVLAAQHNAHAQPTTPTPPPSTDPDPPTSPDPEQPASVPPIAPPPSTDPVVADPEPSRASTSTPPPALEEKMSEGRLLTSLYNSGFQWGISPGVVFSRGKAGFALGLSFGYGFDTGPVILVPGVRLTGYFTDPSVYVGMPTFKIVFPIDRFAPFVLGGLGVGHVTSDPAAPAKSGLAAMGGGGFMIYFRSVAFGAEASYQVITGTSFKGFGVGPILAIGF